MQLTVHFRNWERAQVGRQVPAATLQPVTFFGSPRGRRYIGKTAMQAIYRCQLDIPSDELFFNLLVIPKSSIR